MNLVRYAIDQHKFENVRINVEHVPKNALKNITKSQFCQHKENTAQILVKVSNMITRAKKQTSG